MCEFLDGLDLGRPIEENKLVKDIFDSIKIDNEFISNELVDLQANFIFMENSLEKHEIDLYIKSDVISRNLKDILNEVKCNIDSNKYLPFCIKSVISRFNTSFNINNVSDSYEKGDYALFKKDIGAEDVSEIVLTFRNNIEEVVNSVLSNKEEYSPYFVNAFMKNSAEKLKNILKGLGDDDKPNNIIFKKIEEAGFDKFNIESVAS